MDAEQAAGAHPDRQRSYEEQSRLRWHLVNVNDGIISAAGVIEGVVSVGAPDRTVLTVGILVLVAGAVAIGAMKFSEAAAERDAQQVVIEAERRRLEQTPAEELAELTEIYQDKGLSPGLAAQVAEELSARDALAAQLDAEYGLSAAIDPVRPLGDAAAASLGFAAGAFLPLAIVVITPSDREFWVTFGAVVVALAVSGVLEARTSGTGVARAMLRLVLIGMTTMAVTAVSGLLLS